MHLNCCRHVCVFQCLLKNWLQEIFSFSFDFHDKSNICFSWNFWEYFCRKFCIFHFNDILSLKEYIISGHVCNSVETCFAFSVKNFNF